MFLRHVAYLAFLSITFVEILALQVQNAPPSLNQDNSSLPLPMIPTLNSTKDLNTSSINEEDISCNGSAYGSNLNINSCSQASHDMSKSWQEVIYRNSTDHLPSDVRLPQLILSSKLLGGATV